MELSSTVQRGLQAAGSSVVSDQVFLDLARQAVEDSIAPSETSDLKSKRINVFTASVSLSLSRSQALSGADQAVLKEAHASLMTLTLEAARTDSDSAIVR